MKTLLNHKTVFFVVLVCIALVTGCASVPMKVAPPPDFMSQKGTIGVIWTNDGKKSTAQMYKLGSQGLLDMAINQAMAGKIIKRLDKEEIAPLVKRFYLDMFSAAFSVEGFEIQTVDTAYDKNKLKKIKKNKAKNEGLSPYDFKSIAEELQVNRLMVLDIQAFGIARSYYGFIPTSQPKGYAQVIGYLLDGSSNLVIGQQYSKNIELSQGEWDVPPEYTNLMRASVTSLEKSIDEIFITIFGRVP